MKTDNNQALECKQNFRCYAHGYINPTDLCYAMLYMRMAKCIDLNRDCTACVRVVYATDVTTVCHTQLTVLFRLQAIFKWIQISNFSVYSCIENEQFASCVQLLDGIHKSIQNTLKSIKTATQCAVLEILVFLFGRRTVRVTLHLYVKTTIENHAICISRPERTSNIIIIPIICLYNCDISKMISILWISGHPICLHSVCSWTWENVFAIWFIIL